MKYLSKEQLKGFEKYKYSSIDTCILSKYVMHPFWDWCVQFFPKWMAPNVMTFVGFLLTVVNFLIFSWYDYSFYGSMKQDSTSSFMPRWLWAVTAINMFTAYTLDGIDGKQARRTGMSGPLGELFDHGVDSYTTVLIPTYIYSIFGRKILSPLRLYFLLWLVFTNFYLPHWEKYNTGVMFLPWGYDFTMVSVVLILFATFVMGPGVWDMQLPYGWQIGPTVEVIMYSSSILTGYPVMVWNIYKSYKDKSGKMRSLREAVRPLVPYLLFFLIATCWAVYSPSNVIDKEPRIFYLLLGTIFSNISCRLIVAQMSNTRCEIFNVLLYPYLLTVIIILTVPISGNTELMLLYGLTFILSVVHFHYGVGLVNDLCNHFNIKCFKVKQNSNNNNIK